MAALGMIEVYGYTTSIVVADTVAKAADVKVVAIDKNKPANADKCEVPLVMVVKFMGNAGAVQSALDAVRSGSNPDLTTREKHLRECFVVAEEGADLARIEREIVTMPNYFADYNTIVHFITEEEMARDHSGIPHGGFVIHAGKTGKDGEHTNIMEYNLKLDSNPEFTASVLVACARAAYRMKEEGAIGCKTILDIPPSYLSPASGEELRKRLL